MSTAGQKLQLTWAEAVAWYRIQPNNDAAIEANYFDSDVLVAASRFAASDEFMATLKFIPPGAETVLDLGAGRGIASFAFAANGFQVSALEPDGGSDMGAGAIEKLAATAGIGISITTAFGEQLPFESESFDVVYARQVLHHARDLKQLCREIARVLKKSGTMIAVREHVVKTPDDLSRFLESHPLHHLYGGENAYTLEAYQTALTDAGLRLTRVLSPYESVINYFPMTATAVWQHGFRRKVKSLGLTHGSGLLWRLLKPLVMRSEKIQQQLIRILQDDYAPGNIYSFIGKK